MLELDLNKKRSLNFEIELSGIDYKQLNGALRFSINNVEYGFPVEVRESSIVVDIPPLKNILPFKLEEGEYIDTKLEVNGNGYYLSPWSGKILIKNPVKMEAKIIESETSKKKPEISIREIVKDIKKDNSQDTTIKKSKYSKMSLDNLTKENIFKYIEINGSKNKMIQETIYKRASELALPSELNKDILKEVIKFLKKKDKNKNNLNN